MTPIYRPKGKAAEYASWALNIYTGCTHGCEDCYAPSVLRKSKDDFADVTVRKGVELAVMRQLEREDFAGETIHLCFTCDPYPTGIDTTPTREIIHMIHDAGAHVQILTKNPLGAELDFDLLGPEDMFGVTITGAPIEIEPNTGSAFHRVEILQRAKKRGIGTWVSCEPVYDVRTIYSLIRRGDFIDRFMIGKLNYHHSDIDWAVFGSYVEQLCKLYQREYVIKDSLRADMERLGRSTEVTR